MDVEENIASNGGRSVDCVGEEDEIVISLLSG